MLFFLGTIFFFLASMILMFSIYLALVANKIVKKKRLEKLFRYILILSVFNTLVYIYQYMYI